MTLIAAFRVTHTSDGHVLIEPTIPGMIAITSDEARAFAHVLTEHATASEEDPK